MENELKKYNQTKLQEAFVKILNGTYNQADMLETLINGMIDMTVKDCKTKEEAKAMVSSAKELAENNRSN